MQSKLHFLLLFAYFPHISLLFDSPHPLLTNKKDIFFKNVPSKHTVFKTKDKRDVSKQNTTLTLYSITK